MNYSVKKLQPETVTSSVLVRSDLTVGTKTQNHITFAVVDATGRIVYAKNGQAEIYTQKRVAAQVADWYNKNQ